MKKGFWKLVFSAFIEVFNDKAILFSTSITLGFVVGFTIPLYVFGFYDAASSIPILGIFVVMITMAYATFQEWFGKKVVIR